MEIEQLRQFLKTADERNFTRAAEILGLSQSALSRSIGRLEQELGQPLFERLARNIRLTDSGELLYARAQQILRLVEDTQAEICDDGQTGRVRVGAIPTIAPYFLPRILGDFARKCPQAQVLVQEDTTDNLVKACKHGELDLIVLALPITEKYLEVETLFDEELFIVLPVDHPLASKKQLHLTDLEQFPFVLLAEAHCLADNILSFCRQRAFHPVSVERTTQLTTIQELVALNHGVSLVPAMARRIDQNDRRVYRSLSGTKPRRTIAIVSSPYRFHSKLVQAFAEQLRQAALTLPGIEAGSSG